MIVGVAPPTPLRKPDTARKTYITCDEIDNLSSMDCRRFWGLCPIKSAVHHVCYQAI